MSSCTFRCVPHTFFPSSSDVVSGGCHSPVTAPVSRPFFLKYPFFYSDTPFFLSRSRQARSYGFVCRPMYVSSPCPIGTAAFGRTLAINSKTGSASYRNQYEWKLFQMNFRRSQIIFPCANLWNSFHFFRKCQWPIRKYRPCLLIPESSFFCTHKKRIHGLIICCHLTQ